MEEKRIEKTWEKGTIIKMLGRKIGYKTLENRLQQLWAQRGVLRIVDQQTALIEGS